MPRAQKYKERGHLMIKLIAEVYKFWRSRAGTCPWAQDPAFSSTEYQGGGALPEETLSPGQRDGMYPAYMICCVPVPYGCNWFWNLLSVPMHPAVASGLLDISLLPCFSFLTRWPIQEGLDPDSVLSTLFSPPSFSLCLVGAGQFHLLHVSVSVLLVFSKACLSERVSLPSCFPSCSPCCLQACLSPDPVGPLLTGAQVARFFFLNGGKSWVYSYFFPLFKPPFTSNLDRLCPLVEYSRRSDNHLPGFRGQQLQ